MRIISDSFFPEYDYYGSVFFEGRLVERLFNSNEEEEDPVNAPIEQEQNNEQNAENTECKPELRDEEQVKEKLENLETQEKECQGI
ncbi:hypothetical protein PMALA_043810 [Plasmodium malariae]|uniref:Uncharacterized protein n=1 Tax=Plasmodium malariae TaxID=5858 RepID=A0A1A8WRS8_PLAMA|nr:hypothetical protein PMALA_043810 [Plasmodium malariae]